VTAIFPEEDVPPNMTSYIEKNREVFNSDTPPGRPQR
jgi:ferredoxin